MDPHVAAINDLVMQIATKRELRSLPFVDPLFGGVDAELLFVLKAPAADADTRLVGTRFLSLDNDDPGAANMFLECERRQIDRRRCLAWNICPFPISGRNPDPEELAEAMPYTAELLDLLPDLKVVVLLGKAAREAWPRELLAFRPDVAIVRGASPFPPGIDSPSNRASFEHAMKTASGVLDRRNTPASHLHDHTASTATSVDDCAYDADNDATDHASEDARATRGSAVHVYFDEDTTGVGTYVASGEPPDSFSSTDSCSPQSPLGQAFTGAPAGQAAAHMASGGRRSVATVAEAVPPPLSESVETAPPPLHQPLAPSRRAEPSRRFRSVTPRRPTRLASVELVGSRTILKCDPAQMQHIEYCFDGEYRLASPTSDGRHLDGRTYCLDWSPPHRAHAPEEFDVLAGLLRKALAFPIGNDDCLDLALVLDWYKKPDANSPLDTSIGAWINTAKYRVYDPPAQSDAEGRLTECLREAVQCHPALREADYVVSVPGSRADGFSMGETLARRVAHTTNKKLIRTAGRPRPPRKAGQAFSVRGHFSISDQLDGTCIVVDDVLRSGETVDEAARAARHAGASAVYGLVAAKTMRS